MRILILIILSVGIAFGTCTTPCVASTAKAGSTNGVTTNAIDTSGSSLLVVIVTTFSVSGTLTDSKSNTWTKLTNQTAGGALSAIYYAENPTVGSGHTFTLSGVSVFPGIAVAAFSGVKLSAPFDKQNGNAATTGTSSLTGSVTPVENGELLVSGMGVGSGVNNVSIDSSFTITDTITYGGGTNYGQSLAYRIQATAAAINPSWSWTTSATPMNTIATFKAAPAATFIRHKVIQ